MEAFSSPFKVCILILFILSGLSAPLIKALARTFVAGLSASSSKDHESDSDDEQRLILLDGTTSGVDWKRRLSLHRRGPRVSRVQELEDEDGQMSIRLL